MLQASPKKLRNGSWGALVQGQVTAGDAIQVTTRAGKTWTAAVGRVIWSGERDGGTVAIVSTSLPKSPTRAPERTCTGCGLEYDTLIVDDLDDPRGIHWERIDGQWCVYCHPHP